MKRILVVDDEPGLAILIASILKRALGNNGEAIASTNLSEAMSILKNQGPFDLVITDFNIPSGSEGAQITQAAKALYANIPVIVMSGRMEAQRQQIHELCNANEYVAKTILDWNEFVGTVKHLLQLPTEASV
jgi:CheY-like chemotaxis protein